MHVVGRKTGIARAQSRKGHYNFGGWQDIEHVGGLVLDKLLQQVPTCLGHEGTDALPRVLPCALTRRQKPWSVGKTQHK
jgi:hypothetical protein